MTYLDRLERFMSVYAGSTVTLNPPATAAQIASAEAAMGLTLPSDVRAAYLRFNGVAREPYVDQPVLRPGGPALFLHSYDWVDLSQMVKWMHTMKMVVAGLKADGHWPDVPEDELGHVSDSVRPFDWHPQWIPIGCWGGAFDKVYIDLAPARAGTDGQIVYGGTDRGPELAANSFESYVTRLLDAHDSGKLVVDRDGVWRTAEGSLGRRLPS